MRYAFFLLVHIAILSCNNASQKTKADENSSANPDTSWTLLPFTKVDDTNPIMSPDSTTEFLCPIKNQKVKWEEKDVFNPAAVVRNDTVFLLYRAEEDRKSTRLNSSHALLSRMPSSA